MIKHTTHQGLLLDAETFFEDMDLGCFAVGDYEITGSDRLGYNSEWVQVAEHNGAILEARGMSYSERITYRGKSTMYRLVAA